MAKKFKKKECHSELGSESPRSNNATPCYDFHRKGTYCNLIRHYNNNNY